MKAGRRWVTSLMTSSIIIVMPRESRGKMSYIPWWLGKYTVALSQLCPMKAGRRWVTSLDSWENTHKHWSTNTYNIIIMIWWNRIIPISLVKIGWKLTDDGLMTDGGRGLFGESFSSSASEISICMNGWKEWMNELVNECKKSRRNISNLCTWISQM